MSSIPAFLGQSQAYFAHDRALKLFAFPIFDQRTETLGLAALFVLFSLTSVVALIGL